MSDKITISRETLFNGTGALTPFSWLYTVTVPGERFPFRGKGIGWATGIAKKYARTTGLPVVREF